jgi:membrane protein
MDEHDRDSVQQRFVLRRVVSRFFDDQCTDLAAALTYYGVLSLFPAAVALISLLGIVGQGTSTIDALLQVLNNLGGDSIVSTLRDPLEQLAVSRAAGFGLAIGLLTAVWSASGYVGAFWRAMNRIHQVDEKQPLWKLKTLQLIVTLICVALVTLAALILVVTGPVADAVGRAIGVGDTLVTVWNVAKWPVLLIVVAIVVALLYQAAPSLQRPRFRWLSLGALVAIVIWGIASALFGFYVSRFSSYDKTYGTLAGVVVFLLWLWITNVALLFGAELDVELDRGKMPK